VLHQNTLRPSPKVWFTKTRPASPMLRSATRCCCGGGGCWHV